MTVRAANKRDYDIVLFGATGFTGQLTAEYLATHAPEGCRWALAGRNGAKLEEVRTTLAALDSRCASLPILIADVSDAAALQAVAESAKVVITTVGPYYLHGEPVVAACAAAGTDYVDLTGEPEFVDTMYARYHAKALQSGARIVHACGFDSIPYDLGAYFTVQQLPKDVPITLDGVVRAGGLPSGGTFHSAIGIMSRLNAGRKAAANRRRIEPRPSGRSAKATETFIRRSNGMWLVPLPTLDPMIVARSGRALADYGPDFTYHHYAGVKTTRMLIGGGVGLGAILALAQLGPTRKLLLSQVKQGDGPSPERRSKSWFKIQFTGRGGGRTVVTEVSGGDPGYTETSKMLAESALCLAFDTLPETAGQVTTAQAMGDALIDRLMKAGISFEVVSSA